MSNQEKFNKLVVCAEKFIENNAKNIIEVIRGKKYNSVFEMINEKYKPLCENIDDITFDIILKRLLVQLQNYQAMPKAINYFSYSKNSGSLRDAFLDDENEIYKNVQEYFEKHFASLTDNKDTLSTDLRRHINITNSKSNAWKKYLKGVASVLIKIKGKDDTIKKAKNKFAEEIKEYCCSLDKDPTNRKLIREFHKNIYSIADTLTYDFFKELHCKNLIKDDSHIVECYKQIFGNYKNIFSDFLNMSNKYCENTKYTPYYIDKIVWLCCTGNFYEDGIIVNKMTQKNFFKFISERI